MSTEELKKLKVGDIKKFKFNWGESIGIVKGKDILLIDGRELPLHFASGYSSVRLESKVRAMLEAIAKDIKDSYKMGKDIEMLMLKKSELEYKSVGDMRKVKALMGDSNAIARVLLDGFVCKLEGNLAKKIATIAKYRGLLGSYIHVGIEDSSKFVVRLDLVVDKYIRDKGYSFVVTEYDGSLHISGDTTSLEKRYIDYGVSVKNSDLCKQYISNSKCENSVDIGDKDTLILSKTYTFMLKKKILQKEDIQSLLDIFYMIS